MKHFKYFYLIMAFFALTTSAIANDLTNNIRNFQPLMNNISTSGTIGERGFKALSDANFAIIIDARTPPEGTAAEKKRVEALGMTYYNLPIDGRSIPTARVDALAKILAQNKGKKILLHCVSANRAGALWAEYQITQGVDGRTAISQGKKIGMGAGLENWVRTKHKIAN